MGRILAIDYGQKRVGLAVTDSLKIIATNLTTVSSRDIFEYLKNYIQKEDVELFVVGLAKKMDNTESSSMRFIKPFADKLKKTFSQIPVDMYDERFTSKLAFQTMIDGGLRKKNRQNKALIDSVSATILLQDYLEYLKLRKK
ncbi:MAG: Holliday junction resolvase RuvX [Bacteroidetes bacterium CG23_combo_of_CG06-09_8_20_14_all_32_9]|nr:MAG: Holliday junction resolvase RuvX [Bacteroidetes bacterium CG23_combo_of_CG06-09_8_20_14_all_32_9]